MGALAVYILLPVWTAMSAYSFMRHALQKFPL